MGRWDGNIRRADLRARLALQHLPLRRAAAGARSASPGLASLHRRRRPADAPYLYFVGRNDGTHVFAETYAEHNRNVDYWQRRYWREHRAEERRRAAGQGSTQR